MKNHINKALKIQAGSQKGRDRSGSTETMAIYRRIKLAILRLFGCEGEGQGEVMGGGGLGLGKRFDGQDQKIDNGAGEFKGRHGQDRLAINMVPLTPSSKSRDIAHQKQDLYLTQALQNLQHASSSTSKPPPNKIQLYTDMINSLALLKKRMEREGARVSYGNGEGEGMLREIRFLEGVVERGGGIGRFGGAGDGVGREEVEVEVGKGRVESVSVTRPSSSYPGSNSSTFMQNYLKSHENSLQPTKKYHSQSHSEYNSSTFLRSKKANKELNCQTAKFFPKDQKSDGKREYLEKIEERAGMKEEGEKKRVRLKTGGDEKRRVYSMETRKLMKSQSKVRIIENVPTLEKQSKDPNTQTIKKRARKIRFTQFQPQPPKYPSTQPQPQPQKSLKLISSTQIQSSHKIRSRTHIKIQDNDNQPKTIKYEPMEKLSYSRKFIQSRNKKTRLKKGYRRGRGDREAGFGTRKAIGTEKRIRLGEEGDRAEESYKIIVVQPLETYEDSPVKDQSSEAQIQSQQNNQTSNPTLLLTPSRQNSQSSAQKSSQTLHTPNPIPNPPSHHKSPQKRHRKNHYLKRNAILFQSGQLIFQRPSPQKSSSQKLASVSPYLQLLEINRSISLHHLLETYPSVLFKQQEDLAFLQQKVNNQMSGLTINQFPSSTNFQNSSIFNIKYQKEEDTGDDMKKYQRYHSFAADGNWLRSKGRLRGENGIGLGQKCY